MPMLPPAVASGTKPLGFTCHKGIGLPTPSALVFGNKYMAPALCRPKPSPPHPQGGGGGEQAMA